LLGEGTVYCGIYGSPRCIYIWHDNGIGLSIFRGVVGGFENPGWIPDGVFHIVYGAGSTFAFNVIIS